MNFSILGNLICLLKRDTLFAKALEKKSSKKKNSKNFLNAKNFSAAMMALNPADACTLPKVS